MSKNIGPLDPGMRPSGKMTLNERPLTVYMDVPNLPAGGNGEVCREHIVEGRASDMMDGFWLMGCTFPEPGEQQIIRTAFTCPGPSMFKKCRLTLMQARADGEVIDEASFNR